MSQIKPETVKESHKEKLYQIASELDDINNLTAIDLDAVLSIADLIGEHQGGVDEQLTPGIQTILRIVYETLTSRNERVSKVKLSLREVEKEIM